ncbi:flavodoxin domain-containing protein [Streptomyces sp. Ag109_O5-10]|uniref:flavodoxin domain-containing protein n=1 Tax=Streptomyces sp. Ag109_O5-10 TaxID=1855349 RepID=UPI000899F34C|nr:flavodoxin domain-containing protein [Streptomyces sp. Ag109_O5-10]SED84484.1 menaquinone-dependent protoporphyrinogen oxidase [Streptomyces sp. Ag109_O5-10]
MTGTVLVTYGTKNGSTAHIAESIADALREKGLTVETMRAGSVPFVDRYDAVVVGGGLYAGRWHKDARSFVRRHRKDLAGRPVWFFSSGPLDTSASERDIPPVRGVRRAIQDLHARGHATFGGCLDDDADGWPARWILRSGNGGDFRDFEAVTAWASGIAGELKG